jgi:hypothetical protein
MDRKIEEARAEFNEILDFMVRTALWESIGSGLTYGYFVP